MTEYRLKPPKIQAFKVTEEAPIFPVHSIGTLGNFFVLYTQGAIYGASKGEYCVIINSVIAEVLSPDEFHKKYEKVGEQSE